MTTPKEKLIEMIDAFATAKGTSNSLLINLSVKVLYDYLAILDINEKKAEEDEFSVPPQQNRKTTAKNTVNG